MTTTPEQLQAWREEFERPKRNKTPMLAILLYEKQENEIYRINDVECEWQGYLRRCQETEQAMKLAKFGAEIANYVDGMGAISSVAIWRIAKRVGVLTEDETEYAPNIGETIERLLK